MVLIAKTNKSLQWQYKMSMQLVALIIDKNDICTLSLRDDISPKNKTQPSQSFVEGTQVKLKYVIQFVTTIGKHSSETLNCFTVLVLFLHW